MWSQLADVLSRGDLRQILDSLPAELQKALRHSLDDRPLSFGVLRDNPLQAHIERWCRCS